MKFDILTLFPEFFETPLKSSIIKRAIESNKVSFNITNIRDFSTDKHKKADDRPFGGGCGMVMKVEPIYNALQHLKIPPYTKVIFTCPTGKPYSQAKAIELSKEENLVILCGHYEGIDERVRKYLINDEISMGDYVLTGGEIPALIIIDSIVRLLPEVLGNEFSALQDSFSDGLLDCPHYTRPEKFNDWDVPQILLSGNHQNIDNWRLKEKFKLTLLKRPDLMEKFSFDKRTKKLFEEAKNELIEDLP